MVINSIVGADKADVTVLKEDSNRILSINTTNIIYYDKELLSSYVPSSCFWLENDDKTILNSNNNLALPY